MVVFFRSSYGIRISLRDWSRKPIIKGDRRNGDRIKEPEMVVARPLGGAPLRSGDAENTPPADGRRLLKTSEDRTQPVADRDDYCGMPLEEWKAALKKDVEDRFGPTPNDLKPAGEAGW